MIHYEKHKEVISMANRTIAEIISSRRKEKGMTQKELADLLNITDKAVSKWERGIACPDTQTIPKVAQILDLTIEELLVGESSVPSGHKGAEYLIPLILKAVPMAMGIAITVTAMLGQLDVQSGFSMTGIGLACIGIYLLREKN